MAARKLHIFTATHAEAKAIRGSVPREIGITVIGLRGAHLPNAIEADVLVLAGFAGGLDPTLAVGDVIVDCPAEIAMPPGCRRGSFVCVEQIVSTPAQKAALHQQTGAMAVEMESTAVRALAERAGIPLIHIRAISDTADESLDPAFLRMLGDRGEIRPAAVAAELLRDPVMISGLIRLGAHSRRAGKQLSAALGEMIGIISITAIPHMPRSFK